MAYITISKGYCIGLNERCDLKESSAVFVELPKVNTINVDKNCLIGVIYKPPNNNVYEFLDMIAHKLYKYYCHWHRKYSRWFVKTSSFVNVGLTYY